MTCLQESSTKLYWIITSVAYILGLVATFISLFLMNSAQPALLYLVPFTLIPTIIVAWLRGDLPAMWEGDNKDEEDGDVCGDNSDAEDDNDDDEDDDSDAEDEDDDDE